MKLYEYMAKEVFRAFDIPVPAGRVAASPEEAGEIARELGGDVAVKSQVLAGGRGKAGGIKFAGCPEEALDAARELLNQEIRGYRVERVLVEEKLTIDQELYLAIAVDGAARSPVVIASSRGGVDIEQVPEADLIRERIDIRWGFRPYQARRLAYRLGLTGAVARGVASIAIRLYRVFRERDAELTEINPLVVCGNDVLAADARLNVDDEALFRHGDLPKVEEGTEIERRVKSFGLSYVELDGDIAVMANGAGITMATLDILQRYGGRPANFLDAGGGAGTEPTARAIETLLMTRPKAILINIFGGITRCDDVAWAIVQVRNTRGIPVPLVVRLVGTNQEEGVRILRENGLRAYSEMHEAAEKVVALASGV